MNLYIKSPAIVVAGLFESCHYGLRIRLNFETVDDISVQYFKD